MILPAHLNDRILTDTFLAFFHNPSIQSDMTTSSFQEKALQATTELKDCLPHSSIWPCWC